MFSMSVGKLETMKETERTSLVVVGMEGGGLRSQDCVARARRRASWRGGVPGRKLEALLERVRGVRHPALNAGKDERGGSMMN